MSASPKPPLSAVIAANIAELMRVNGISQSALAKAAGVSQKTVSNYLNPDQRSPRTDGKDHSANTSELDAIANALGVQAWELLRHISPRERQMYQRIEAAMTALLNSEEDKAVP